MRGIFLAIFICSFLIPGLHAQFSKDSLLNAVKDSLLNNVATSKNDTDRVYSLRLLSEYYVNSHPDSALLFAQQGLELADKMKFGNGKGNCLYSMGKIFLHSGNYTKALESYLKALDVFTLLDDKTWLPLFL